MEQQKKRIYRESTAKSEIVNVETGEVISTADTSITEGYVDREPDYIKLYIDTVLTFKGITKALNPVLIALCKHMNFADKEQIVYVNSYTKSLMMQDTGLKLKRVEQAIKQFADAGIIMRVSRGVYRVNPNIIARGKWNDIKLLRATFNFMTGDIKSDIELGEEPTDLEGNSQQMTIEDFPEAMP